MLNLSKFFKINKVGEIKLEERIKTNFVKAFLIKINGKYTIYIAIHFLFAFALQAQTEIGSRMVNTVVIDPGHGGRDPGAIGRFSKEKEIVLSIAQKLGKLINQRFPEVKVMYTRNDDRFVELYQRAEIANKAKADLFISIHANSTVKQSPSGVEFWVLGLHKADENLEAVKKENAALQFEQDIRKNYGFDPNTPEGSIIMSMQQNLYLDQSIQFAKLMESRFVKEDNQLNRGSKQAGFIVLYKTTMPSVLVEVGFISNPDEEQYIANETGQSKIAVNLANAFADYKIKYESGAIKQVPKESKPKSSNSIELEPIPSNTKGFSTESESNLMIADEDNSPVPTIVEKATPRPDVTAVSTPVETNKNRDKNEPVVVKEGSKNVTIPTVKAPANPKAAASVKVSKEPDLQSSSVKNKPIASKVTPKENDKVSIAEDKISDAKNSKPTATIVTEKKENKLVGIESTPVKKEDKSNKLSIRNEKPDSVQKNSTAPVKSGTRLNTSTPGKIKLEEVNSKVPSYIADREIKNEIISNTKLLDKQKIVLAENKSTDGPLETAKETPVIKPKSLSEPIAKPIKTTSGLVYKIQVKATSTKIKDNDPVQGVNGKIEESFENGLYKYLVGNYKTENEAKAQLDQIKKMGITDAFVVKYKDGIRIK